MFLTFGCTEDKNGEVLTKTYFLINQTETAPSAN